MKLQHGLFVKEKCSFPLDRSYQNSFITSTEMRLQITYWDEEIFYSFQDNGEFMIL